MLLDPSHPAPIWLIWPNLSLLERVSFLTLCILSVYSLFLAADGNALAEHYFRSREPRAY